MGIGLSRVKISQPEKATKVMTKDDVRELIKEKVIVKKRVIGTSSVRAHYIRQQKKKGLRRGSGRRRGTAKARTYKKGDWMRKIRAIRRTLKGLKSSLKPGAYRKLYNMAKGGYFRDKAHLRTYVTEKDLLVK